MVLRAFRRKLFFSSLLLFSVCGLGQDGLSATSSSSDVDLPIPVPTGILGKHDALALTEVLEHLKVVSVSPWVGMQGTGQIVYGSAQGPAGQTPYSATFSIIGSDRFRLDSQTVSGPMSIRIHKRIGKVQGGDGGVSSIPAETATLGIVQFELPRLADFSNANASLFAKEAVALDGATLHRVAYEFSSLSKAADKTAVTDLYFDAASHLLVKTAASILLEGTNNNRLLQVITYGDYRKVGSSLIPFRYTQTLGGQLQWTLQLSDVQLNPVLNGTFFEF